MTQAPGRMGWSNPPLALTVVLLALAALGLTATAARAAGPDLQTQVLINADGTAPFDASAGPGLDDGETNQVVRTLDVTTFQVNWSANNPANTTPVLRLQLPPGGYAFTNQPTAGDCPGGLTVSPARDAIACSMGPFNSGADSITKSVMLNVSVPATVTNGRQFRLAADFGDGVVSAPSESPLITVSSAPNYDLFKSGCFTDCALRAPEVRNIDTDGDGTPDTLGFVYDYGVGLRTDAAGGKGSAQLAEPLVVTDDVRIPAGTGTNGRSLYPVAAGQPGLRLIGCDSGSGHGNYWPRAQANGARDRSVDPIAIACEQPLGKGTPARITLSGFDWDRVSPPPTIRGSGQYSSPNRGVIGYAHVKYFLSYEDWERIGTDRGALRTVPLPGGGTRVVGTVALGDRLNGTTALGDPVTVADTGYCGTPGSDTTRVGWRAPTNVDLLDPSTFDPVDVGGSSNLGTGVESAANNGACLAWTIAAPVASRGQLNFVKTAVAPGGTSTGPVVAHGSAVATGLALANAVTLNSEAGITDPVTQAAAGTTMCDKWDNRRYGPDAALGEEWIVPQAVANAADGGRQDYNAEYGDAGHTVEYATGAWGTHGGSDEGTSYYWQGRSRCEDRAMPYVSAGNPGSRLLPLPALPGDTGDVYWVGAGEVDFTNSGLKRIDADQLNAVRVRLNEPLGGMFPSEVAARNGDADPDNDTSQISDVAPVTRTTQARFVLNWRNRADIALPAQMRNYAALVHRFASASAWTYSTQAATSSDDTTKRAAVSVGCGAPCGNAATVGSTNYALWWQVLGPDLAVEKTRVDGGGAPIANNGVVSAGDEVRWRLRARGAAPLGTPAATPGATPTVTLMDVLPPGLDYVPGSTLSSGDVALGEPTVLHDNSLGRTGPAYAGYTTLQWTVPSLPWAPNFTTRRPVELTIATTVSPDMAPSRTIAQSFFATAPSITLPDEEGNQADPAGSFRRADAAVRTPAGGATAVLNKTVEPAQLMRHTPFRYSLKFANYSATPIAEFEAIDLLPWAGDRAHARRSLFGRAEPIVLESVTRSAAGEVVWVSSTDPVALDAADVASGHTADPAHDGYLDPDHAAALGSPQWPCTVDQVGQGGAPAGCPASLAEVTALRFVGAGTRATPFLPANSSLFTIELGYRTTGDAQPGDVYDNSWMARFDNLLPVYRPILAPPSYAAPGVSVAKLSGPTASGPWSESTLVHGGRAAFFQVTVTNTGTNPLVGFAFEDVRTDACESPSPAPPASLAAGASFTFVCSDPAPATGYVNTIEVTAEDADGNPAQDDDTAAIRVAARVGDRVWLDDDRDGVQDAGEPGIAGIEVRLSGPGGGAVTDLDGTAVGAQLTDADGSYLFTNLPPLPAGQHYTVTLDNAQPALDGLTPTLAGRGGDAGRDSSDGSADSGDLDGADPSDLTLDFGFLAPAVSVGDLVWRDGDGDGVQDPGEPGIAGVELTLTGPGGGAVTDVTGAPVGPVTTGAGGAYAFVLLSPLPAGEHYTVHVDPDQAALRGAGLKPTLPGVGGGADDSSDGSAESGDLDMPGAVDDTLDFGFLALARVCGTVYADSDLDRSLGTGEPGVGGTTVVLSGTDDLGQPVRATMAAAADGSWCVAVRPGTYDVTIETPEGWDPDTPTEIRAVVVPPGAELPGHDFGLVQADLAISKTAAASSYAPGETASFTLEVVNNGPTAATGVTVTDTLPAGLAYAGADIAGCSVAAETVTCAVGDLAVGASATFVVQARVTRETAGELVNSATIAGQQPDPVEQNDAASATITVVPPTPPVVDPPTPKTPDPPAPPAPPSPPAPPVAPPVVPVARRPVDPRGGKPAARVRPRAAALKAGVKVSRSDLAPGDQTTLAITVRNPSAIALRNVSVCDTLPSSLAYVDAAPKPVSVGGQVCFVIRTLKPGGAAVVRIRARALYVPRGVQLRNRVTVGGQAVKPVAMRSRLSIRVRPTRVSDKVTG
ncbi:MAG TPA: SdrD B-like domain-containing protein [Conexibacter sp.]|nr:SdrD B-like domain-containing protein [Conexibacter sp.]